MHRHEISLGKILGIPLFERQSIQRCYTAITPQLFVECAFWDNASLRRGTTSPACEDRNHNSPRLITGSSAVRIQNPCGLLPLRFGQAVPNGANI